MIPFQKIFTILIRTFSRPMIGYFKQKKQLRKNNWMGIVFIFLGRRTYAVENWMSYRILKTQTQRKKRQYKQQVLLEKGVETFFQILFYLIVLGLPFWQLYKSSIASQKKEEALQKRITNLDKKMEQINKSIRNTIQFLKKKQISDKQLLKKKRMQKAQRSKQQKQKIDPQLSIESFDSFSEEKEKQVNENKIEVEQLLENALQVMADEFEDSLDDLQIFQSNEVQDVGEGEGAQNADGLDSLEDTGEVDAFEANEVDAGDALPDIQIPIQTQVEIQIDAGDVGSIDLP